MKNLRMAMAAMTALAGTWALAGERAAVTLGGTLEVPGLGVAMMPNVYAENWKGLSANGPYVPDEDGSWDFEVVSGKDKVIDGEAKFTRAGDAVEAEWEFELERDFTSSAVAVALTLPVQVFAGGSFELDAEKYDFKKEKPVKNDAVAGKVTRVLLRAADARTLTLEFPCPVQVSVQDNRLWAAENYSLRVTLASGRLVRDSEYSLRVRLTTSQGIDELVSGPVVIHAGEDWIPLHDTTAVAPGSAFDFSTQGWTEAPAGKYGRVKAVGENFEFENLPGKPQRFYGVNLCFTANFLTADQAEELATRLQRLGYNALRIHHFDGQLTKGSDGTRLNEEEMAKLDHVLNACIRHGLYVTTDLFVSRQSTWRSIGIDREGVIPASKYKELCLFHEGAYRNLCEFSRQFLTHVNPETGRRWADEPALAWIAMINEGNPGNYGLDQYRDVPEANAKWKAWLKAAKERDPSLADVTDAVPPSPWDKSRQVSVFCRFLADLQSDFDRRFLKFLREEIGCGALFSNLSSWYNPPDYQRCRQAYDYVDDHFYVDHPRFLGGDWRLPSRCDNVNPARVMPGGLKSIEQHRLADRPFTLTEFNFSAPGSWRGIGGIMLGAQAAQCGYDAVWRFAWSHDVKTVIDGGKIGYFDTASDPLTRATERAAMSLFLGNQKVQDVRTNGTFAVKSEGTCGFACEGGRYRSGCLAADVQLAPAAIWATAIDGKPLRDSSRILVSHVTDVQDEGVKYADVERKILLAWGELPHLMRRGKASVALLVPTEGEIEVWALKADGSRARRVPALVRRGFIFFNADTGADPNEATFAYEVIRR